MNSTFVLPLNSKAIPLSKGKYAIVDEEDYEWLMQWKWQFGGGGYATRRQHIEMIGEKRILKTLFMHRVILNTPDVLYTDHKNGIRTDNRRCNIRVCTPSQNQYNTAPMSGYTSKFKGVSLYKKTNKWVAQIRGLNKKKKHLGYFTSEIDAADAYNKAAKELHGDFAILNVI